MCRLAAVSNKGASWENNVPWSGLIKNPNTLHVYKASRFTKNFLSSAKWGPASMLTDEVDQTSG